MSIGRDFVLFCSRLLVPGTVPGACVGGPQLELDGWVQFEREFDYSRILRGNP